MVLLAKRENLAFILGRSSSKTIAESSQTPFLFGLKRTRKRANCCGIRLHSQFKRSLSTVVREAIARSYSRKGKITPGVFK